MAVTVYWLLQRASNMPPSDDWLTAAERAVLGRLQVPKRRNDWRLGRWTAKRALLAAGLEGLPSGRGMPPARLIPLARQLSIRPNPDGAPEAWLEEKPVPLPISLAHSGERAVCAVAEPGSAVGCDLEKIELRSEAFGQTWFTEAECRLVAQWRDARAVLQTVIWSAKESVSKSLGIGLTIDTRQLDVTPGFGGAPGWQSLDVRVGQSGIVFRGWWIADEGDIITIAATPDPRKPVRLDIEATRVPDPETETCSSGG